MVDIHQLVAEKKELVVRIRRDLHRIPETAYTEKKTSAYVAEHLIREGLEVQTGISTYGVVGLLNTGRPGPTLLLRADMDALPVTEDTGLPFASTHDGAMHACGHDAHVAMVLVAATVLNQVKDKLNGTIKFLFQPAEEGPGGAKPMIDEGVLENPKVDYSIGCHVWPEIPEGTIGVRSGPFMAAMDRFDIKIIGRSGHGAMPHLCVDALEVGAQVVNEGSVLAHLVFFNTKMLDNNLLHAISDVAHIKSSQFLRVSARLVFRPVRPPFIRQSLPESSPVAPQPVKNCAAYST